MKTANDIAGRHSPLRDAGGPIELVYGILENGTAYLYLSLEQALMFTRSTLGVKSLSGVHFASLSPALYTNELDLVATLDALTPKYRKKGYDDSPLNKLYAMPIHDHGARRENIRRRAAFEQQRLLRCILRSPALFDYRKFSLESTPWNQCNVRLFSLYFSTYEPTELGVTERRQCLDCGLSELSIEGNGTLRIRKTSYVSIKTSRRHRTLARVPFVLSEPADTAEDVSQADFSVRIYDLIETTVSRAPDAVNIFLVYNANATCAYLQSLNLNVTGWETGINSLFVRSRAPPSRRSSQSDHHPHLSYGSPDYDRRSSTLHSDWDARTHSRGVSSGTSRDDSRNSSRQRSLSPRSRSSTLSRGRDYSSPQPSSSQPTSSRSGTAPVTRRRASMHLVDIADLYRTLTMDQTVNPDFAYVSHLQKQARYLGLKPEAGWCGGNESRMIAQMWAAMASGNPIDVQRADLQRQPKAEAEPQNLRAASTTASASVPPMNTVVKHESDDEDEFDPNSVGEGVPPPRIPGIKAEGDEDDEDDFDPNSVDASVPPPAATTATGMKPLAETRRNPMDLDSDDSDAEEIGW